jgi:hypothetical protein
MVHVVQNDRALLKEETRTREGPCRCFGWRDRFNIALIKPMLKITTQMNPTETILEVEGKLAGPWIEELANCWRKARNSDRPVKVMLCAVTFIDDKGRNLLVEMYRQGAKLVAEGCMNKAIVEEIIRGERL